MRLIASLARSFKYLQLQWTPTTIHASLPLTYLSTHGIRIHHKTLLALAWEIDIIFETAKNKTFVSHGRIISLDTLPRRWYRLHGRARLSSCRKSLDTTSISSTVCFRRWIEDLALHTHSRPAQERGRELKIQKTILRKSSGTQSKRWHS